MTSLSPLFPIERRRPRAFTLIELLVVISIIAVLVAILIPAVQSARESARKSQCQNNLRQFGIAIQNYHDTHGVLAPGWVWHVHPSGDGDETRGFGWGLYLLPQLDQPQLYDQIDLHRPVDFVGGNAELLLESKAPAVFRCPSYRTINAGQLFGNYFGNFGPADTSLSGPTSIDGGGIFWRNSRLERRQIENRDGASNTLAVGESLVGFWYGTSDDLAADCLKSAFGDINGSGPGDFGSKHTGGAFFLLCDGHVRFINDSIESNPTGVPTTQGLFQNLSQRDDRRPIPDF